VLFVVVVVAVAVAAGAQAARMSAPITSNMIKVDFLFIFSP
jgi:hypothetical protein